MIQLVHVSKQFGQRTVVDDLSLHVPRGEVCGLLGHNGAGKSTSIGMMLGQVWPTAGDVRICGFDVTAQRGQALLKVGALFEAPVFYDYLSGWSNLNILSHYTAPTPPARLREVLDWVGLTGREHAKVRAYSHGMKARLAIAQALLPGPELLILDEPGSGLDPEGTHEMRQTILRLWRELGLTILLSSHLLTEVEQVCSRIVVLNQGKKLFEGPMDQALASRNWTRLRTSDFEAAVRVLKEAGLIVEASEGRRVALAEGAGADQVVRTLVGCGMPVFEIGPEDRTLEQFYLSLMEGRHAPKAAG